MPVHKVPGGWRWGSSGKVYPSKAEAEAQGRAAYANGWSEKGDPFGPAAFQQAWMGSGSAPAPVNDPTYPDEPTAESEDWRAQGDGRILRATWGEGDYTRALAALRVRLTNKPTAIDKLRRRLEKRTVSEAVAAAYDRHYAAAASCLKAEGPSTPSEYAGIPIEIDRPKGYVQTGTKPDGGSWRRVYLYDYGFFPGTEGGDGEGIDLYCGPNPDALYAYWVAQKTFGDPPGFDEWKVFLGFKTAAHAAFAFALHAPRELLGPIYEVPIGVMRSLLGHDPRGPLAGAELLGALRKSAMAPPDDRSEYSEGGRYGAPFPAPDQVYDMPPAVAPAAAAADAFGRLRARLSAMSISKAGEGGEASAEAVGEHAREAAERLGEIGEGHGAKEKPKGHGGKGKPKGHGAKKPAPHGAKEAHPAAPSHGDKPKEKPAAKPKPKGGGGEAGRDDHGRFAAKAAGARAGIHALAVLAAG